MTEDPKRRNPNQRSYHLDDETVALLDAKAHEMTVSQSAVVRMALRAFCSGLSVQQVPYKEPSQLVADTQRFVEEMKAQVEETTGVREIVLPPEDVSEFRVRKTREGEPPAVERRRPRTALEDEGY